MKSYSLLLCYSLCVYFIININLTTSQVLSNTNGNVPESIEEGLTEFIEDGPIRTLSPEGDVPPATTAPVTVPPKPTQTPVPSPTVTPKPSPPKTSPPVPISVPKPLVRTSQPSPSPKINRTEIIHKNSSDSSSNDQSASTDNVTDNGSENIQQIDEEIDLGFSKGSDGSTSLDSDSTSGADKYASSNEMRKLFISVLLVVIIGITL